MHLSPEDIVAAEACGISFLPASDAQVQRLAMQRKVFYRAGAPILATRGDGLFETVGTLQQLIEEGRQQQRDLSQWLKEAEPGAVAASEALPEAAPPAALAPMEPAPLPKRPRQKRRRPELVARELVVPEVTVKESMAEDRVAAELLQGVEAGAEMVELVVAPLSRSLGRTAVRVPAAAAEIPGQDRGKRWLMAGAARRGRAGKHWSTRQR